MKQLLMHYDIKIQNRNVLGRESYPINTVFLWRQEMCGGGSPRSILFAPPTQQKQRHASWRKGQCSEIPFQGIFSKKDLLVQDATFQKALCLYIPVPASLPQHTLLANTGFQEHLVAPWERQLQGKQDFMLGFCTQALPCSTSPPYGGKLLSTAVSGSRELCS